MNESNTVLHPPWLNLARALWILLSVSAVLLLVIGAVSFLRAPLPGCTTPNAACGPWSVSREDLALAQQLGLPADLLQVVYLINSIFPKVCFLAVGLLIFWRKSNDWVALLLSLMLVTFVIEGLQEVEAIQASLALGLLQGVLYVIATGAFLALPFLFPDGRFVPDWTRWIFLPLLVVTLPPSSFPTVVGGIGGELYTFWLLGGFFLWFVVGGYAAVYRYARVSNARERQQTKWVMAGILGTFVLFIPFTITSVVFPPTQPSPERLGFVFLFYIPLGFVSYLFIPGAIAVAILRYRLWDIDLLIRRTVTYSTLTALLLLVYFGSVIVLQQIFSSVTGSLQNEIVTVLSTLAIAALFVPLRNRIQVEIDKRFNRKKYDAQKVLQDFAQTVRDETDLDKLTGRLVQVVDETMQPRSVSVWLKMTNDKRQRTVEK